MSANLLISLVGQECYQTLFVDFDFSNSECLSYLFSKLLGYYMVATGLTLKLPQIAKLVRAKSALGLSPGSYYMETFASMIVLAYSVRNAFPFSTYGETWFILAQNVVIIALMFHYSNQNAGMMQFMVGFALLMWAMLNEQIFVDSLLQILQTVAIPFFISSKIPQIWENYRLGTTGQLAAYTVVNNLLGTSIRAFTTFREVDDMVWVRSG